jgi:phenylpropionate dioxygenase-like ring-hydroxylating dioxygenase large terminal subunit
MTQVQDVPVTVGPLGGRVTRPEGAEAWVPKEPFISPEYAKLEAERLWPRVWQVACREQEVANVGDYVEYTIVDQSVFVVRTEQGTLKAFLNSCLHRGTQLKHGCGNAKEIRCRYHAWRWNLDGSIKEVTDAFDFDPACITPESLQLPECQVDTWGGFVFVNMDPDAETLRDFLGPIADSPEGRYLETMRFERSRSTTVAANWKTALGAFTDGYHFSGTHPQLLYYVDDTTYIYETFEKQSRMVIVGQGKPSPKLGDLDLENKDVLLAWVADLHELKLFNDEQAAALAATIHTLPPEVTPLQFMSSLTRSASEDAGIDTTGIGDDHLIGENVSDWFIFPNSCTPMTALSVFYIRFRPDGLDHESCIIDVWNLRTYPPGTAPDTWPREVYPDWREHDGWGRIFLQDLQNVPNVQKGMHTRSRDRLICGRQEIAMWNTIRVVEQYVGRK